MFKKFSFLLLLFCSSITFAQDMVTAVPMKLKKDRDVFQVVDEVGKKIILFISDKKNVKAVQLNDKMQISDSLTAVRPDSDFKDMIGFNKSEATYRLFWATSNKKEIHSQVFDFEKRSVISQKYSLPLKDEKVVQQFSENDIFYILTAIKNSNIVKLYTFLPDGTSDSKTLELANFRFFGKDFKRTDFYNLVLGEEIKKINTNSPTSLTESSKKMKFYFQDNKIIFTSDANVDYTQIVTIDLTSWAATEKFFKHEYIFFNSKDELNSNSFLMDNMLYQIKINSDQMILTQKDFNDKLIKKFVTLRNQTITYKNSEIIQENGDIKNTRILGETSQFLRKINNAYLGVSAYRLDENYMLTIGSVSDAQNGNAMMYGAMFGVAGVMMAYAISNPTLDNFNSYANRKVVYINGLFDKNGNHLDGKIKPLAFDMIRKFISENKFMSSETLYRFENVYYLGYYDSYEKQYEIRKFQE